MRIWAALGVRSPKMPTTFYTNIRGVRVLPPLFYQIRRRNVPTIIRSSFPLQVELEHNGEVIRTEEPAPGYSFDVYQITAVHVTNPNDIPYQVEIESAGQLVYFQTVPGSSTVVDDLADENRFESWQTAVRTKKAS